MLHHSNFSLHLKWILVIFLNIDCSWNACQMSLNSAWTNCQTIFFEWNSTMEPLNLIIEITFSNYSTRNHNLISNVGPKYSWKSCSVVLCGCALCLILNVKNVNGKHVLHKLIWCCCWNQAKNNEEMKMVLVRISTLQTRFYSFVAHKRILLSINNTHSLCIKCSG